MKIMKTIINLGWFFCTMMFIDTDKIFAKRIYIAPDDHTDYMWKGNEAQYEKAFLDMTDYYLNRMDATASDPSPYQARWNADGSFWMWVYQSKRTPAQFQKLINRIKDGHFSMPLNPLVLANGGTPAEAVLRGMYYPGIIQRSYNLDFPIAISMENQGHPYGLSSLWAGSGAKYSWKGVCGCATKITQLGNRGREIYYGAFNSTTAMKFSLEHQNQLVINSVTGVTPAYPEKEYTFLSISDPNILLWALKPADDGISHGVIARVWNQANANKDYVLSLTPNITSAQRTSHIETVLGNASLVGGNLSTSIKGNQILTYQLKP